MQLALRPRVAKRAQSPDAGIEDDDDDEPPTPRSRPVRHKRRRQRTADESLLEGEDGEEGEAPGEPRQLVQGTPWLPDEDKVLLNAVAYHGPSWKKVAAALAQLGTKRSTAMCRNRYQRINAPFKPGKEGRNFCKKCGQKKKGHICTAEAVVDKQPARVTLLSR